MSPTIISKPKIEIDPDLLAEISAQSFDSGQVVVHCIHYNRTDSMSLIRIWPTTKLFDKQSAHCSELVLAENISYYPEWSAAPPGLTFFSLIFSGLPKSCLSFDLIEDCKGGPFPFQVLNIQRNESDVYFVQI